MGDVNGGVQVGDVNAIKVTAAWDYICSMGRHVTTII